MEQRLQSYNDGAIYRTGVHSYEVRTSHGTGSGSTVAEALKDLADKQVRLEAESEAKDTSLNIDSEDVKQEPVEKPKKRKSSKKKKQTD